MKHMWKSVLALALAIVMLAGCGGGNGNKTEAPETKPAATAAEKDTSVATEAKADAAVEPRDDLVIAISGDIQSLNPYKQNDVGSGYVIRSIYETLIAVNDNNEFVGQLVEDGWEYTDPQTCRFKLKEGITFSNGNPLTAEDVKFSIESQKQQSKTGHLVEFVSEVEVVDELNFIVHLDKVTNVLVSSLAHMSSCIMDKEYVESLEAEGKSIDDYPMGTGAYIFDEWVTGTSVHLHRNPNHWNPDRRALNNSLTFKVIPEEAARTIALETGEVDMVIGISSADANRIRDNADLAMHEYEGTVIEYLAFNTSKAPFDNVELRKAVSHAIRKEDVMLGAINGEGVTRDTYFSPTALGYYGNETVYGYDLEKAKECLAAAGVPDGFEFNLTLAGPKRNRSATVIQENLSKVGITVNIDMMESSAFYEKVGNNAHDACLTGWIPNAEPDNTYRPLFMGTHGGEGNNYAVYKNAEVDKLVDEAAASLDPAVVDQNRMKVLEIVSADAIWCPLYSEKGMIASQADLQGVHTSPMQMHDFMFLHY